MNLSCPEFGHHGLTLLGGQTAVDQSHPVGMPEDFASFSAMSVGILQIQIF